VVIVTNDSVLVGVGKRLSFWRKFSLDIIVQLNDGQLTVDFHVETLSFRSEYATLLTVCTLQGGPKNWHTSFSYAFTYFKY